MLQKQFDIDHQVTILKEGGDWVWFVNDFNGNVIDSPITFPSWHLARLNFESSLLGPSNTKVDGKFEVISGEYRSITVHCDVCPRWHCEGLTGGYYEMVIEAKKRVGRKPSVDNLQRL